MRAFTDEDEQVLTLFASQAASAIANARTHRAERRARADLEALVETSPVGVVVFDAESGRAVSFNREARRIVERLRTPGHPPEQLLEVISFRRADGTEVSLSELSIGQLLQSGETLRAEEVVLSVPDGRSVRTLVNAAPGDPRPRVSAAAAAASRAARGAGAHLEVAFTAGAERETPRPPGAVAQVAQAVSPDAVRDALANRRVVQCSTRKVS